jgi:hypothetical protein
MTGWDDSTPAMASRVSSEAADRLLSGSALPVSDLPASDVPVPEVARLLAALPSPMASDAVREQEAVASFAAVVMSGPAPLDEARSARHGRRTATVVAATAALVLLGGTAATAASGSLPDGPQSVVSKALSHVSVHVPDPDTPHGSTVDHHGPVGPDATEEAKHGLCTAWAARGKADTDRGASGDSTAFSNLRQAAHDDGMLVKEFCAEVLDRHATGANSGAPSTTDHGQSDDPQGQSGAEHGDADDSPAPVATPNGGGVGTGSDASKGANTNGASHAADDAAQGSANADGHGNPEGTSTTTNGSSRSGL